MALDYDDWIPVEIASNEVVAREFDTSAMENFATPVQMVSDHKQIPRQGGFRVTNVAKGGTYVESTEANDVVDLTARKVGGYVKINNEDLRDPAPSAFIVSGNMKEASHSIAVDFDNSTLGTSAAENGTTVKYNSLYRVLTTADAGAGYTANANIDTIAVADTDAITMYDALNTVFGYYEESDYFVDGDTVVFADPRFKRYFRSIKDSNGDPIMLPHGSNQFGRMTYSLFGYEMQFTKGAQVTAVDSDRPVGNPLLFVGRRDFLKKGLAPFDNVPSDSVGFAMDKTLGFLTDTTLLKAAVRRAFVAVNPKGFAGLEVLL